MLLDGDDEQGRAHPLRALNLNLLLHLDAVLRERSVSRAASLLHLSQPTVSAALARLRRHFGDELLERRGHDLVLTPFGAALQPLAEQAVRAVGTVFDSSAVFEPGTSSRSFVIATPDVWVRVVGPRLGHEVKQRAPGVRLHFRSVDPG
jgi:DNA-binding transcriptional LysR family regulator